MAATTDSAPVAEITAPDPIAVFAEPPIVEVAVAPLIDNPAAPPAVVLVSAIAVWVACKVTAPADVTLAPSPMNACTALPIEAVALTKATATAPPAPVDPVAVAFCVDVANTSTLPLVVVTRSPTNRHAPR